VGGLAVPPLLEALGCDVVRLDCEPDGRFTRELEPLPEHLGPLGAAVRDAGADFGLALDPDADRVALVDGAGRPLGEEFTLAIAARTVLARRTGPAVTNLSTSLMMDDVARAAGVPLHRTPVGEAHVVQKMREVGAVVGGEGNGGVILPAAHFGRDALVGAALACQAVVDAGATLRAVADSFGRTAMEKGKVELDELLWSRAAGRLHAAFAGMEADARDGLRFSRGDEWVHVRPSGTEPVVRIIAESRRAERTRELCETARRALAG
jgi:phosphomannomutase